MRKVFGVTLKLGVILLVVTGFPCERVAGQQVGMKGSRFPVISQPSASLSGSPTVLIGLGDSLTQGTMDATNNFINTWNAYLQKVADSLAQVIPLNFIQPIFDESENRWVPSLVPTNLGVDGADIFSLEGIQYYKRAGTGKSFVSRDYLCDKWLPGNLEDKYDKVLYPINVLAGKAVSQIDSATWLLNQNRFTFLTNRAKGLLIFWIGNNDSSTAALGSGGKNPIFLPIPLDQIEPEITPELSFLLRLGQQEGDLSFAPYTQSAIERNLTELSDFANQYNHLLDRLKIDKIPITTPVEVFLLTLPYYSAVGYLMDSEDLEYYLQKLNSAYRVPPTFKRVTIPGEPITDPFQGDRISLLTFGFMYLLLQSGYPIDYVNQILEINGQQRDELVLSEEEQHYIMSRIDGFNDIIKTASMTQGPHVHLVDIGQYLNDLLSGKTSLIIDHRVFSRKWVRGGSFSLDGVHPGYTGQALIANFVLTRLNEVLGLKAPLYDLSYVMGIDPYLDRDGDGWAPGPDYKASGLTELLFLFKDPDDGNPAVQPQLPPEVWNQISDVLMKDILDLPSIKAKAIPLGRVPVK
ncbi:MAG TPA: hypothetical protein VNM22_04410 [Candidatus Limnocylindrales bacterium]|nr:hypothetical protein [Candidatus Limnocylindrales bacterium]